jgi:hypothetical protein
MLRTKGLWTVSWKVTAGGKCCKDTGRMLSNNAREVITEEERMNDAEGITLKVNAHKNKWGEAKSICMINKRDVQLLISYLHYDWH